MSSCVRCLSRPRKLVNHFRGELEEYMQLLVRNFNVRTVANLMCRNLLSVGYDGTIYDCDFNQQLAMPIKDDSGTVQKFLRS